jgi:polysaccharide biosynthesis transport protein
MKIIDFIRLIRKHIILLVVAPLLMASLVILLTMKPYYKYASETTLYTGIASGSSVEMDKSFNFFATTTAFDNLINIIKARETQQEVAIRLLSQHLMLDQPDPKYISARSYEELMRITPRYIHDLVVKNAEAASPVDEESFDSVTYKSLPGLFPRSINQAAYEQTVRNLTLLMQSNDTNFVYKLLNYPNPHYSFKYISTIKVERIANSDLVRLYYETDDPGICQQTLALMNEVCIRNYRYIKENRSDAVVKYFESQLSLAASRLKSAEDNLLQFNKDNNIINYYEQSKAVAVVKEDLGVEYNNKKIKLAGAEAAIKRLEEKLGIQQQIQLKSQSILDKKNLLGDITYQLAISETRKATDSAKGRNISDLQSEAEKLKTEIRDAVGEFYTYGNTVEGLPINTILNDWIANVLEAENLKAGMQVLGNRIDEFQKQYAIYAPAGANVKRIEREISVAEQEYLEILHGLNLAKLKMQDIELSSNIKAVDTPFYPLYPIPTKRKILVILAALFGFLVTFGSILFMEYFDDTLKNPGKASRIIKLNFLGVVPKIFLKPEISNFEYITNRLLEMVIQNIELSLKNDNLFKSTKTLLFYSTLEREGKTLVAVNLAKKLKQMGKKVLVLSPEMVSLENRAPKKQIGLSGLFNRLLGYPDTRVDRDSPFLADPDTILGKEEYLRFRIDDKFYSAGNVEDILNQNGFKPSFVPDFILLELPSILFNPYPVGLISVIDLPVLVCRANRTWSEADRSANEAFAKLSQERVHFILNGSELLAVESVIGELPGKRSNIRRKVKNALRFQFYSKDQI